MRAAVYFLLSGLLAASVCAMPQQLQLQQRQQQEQEEEIWQLKRRDESYTDDKQFQDTILSISNTYRRQHNATGLKWNASLADVAGKWSEGCKFEHSVCRCSFFPPPSFCLSFLFRYEMNLGIGVHDT